MDRWCLRSLFAILVCSRFLPRSAKGRKGGGQRPNMTSWACRGEKEGENVNVKAVSDENEPLTESIQTDGEVGNIHSSTLQLCIGKVSTSLSTRTAVS
ncbi:hypothetical protein OF83DRAFT_1122076 [Amylostereum chailletii]|nr:hypothetical protein OF83DRAFT_1122076 [Amylostereum chailletii]